MVYTSLGPLLWRLLDGAGAGVPSCMCGAALVCVNIPIAMTILASCKQQVQESCLSSSSDSVTAT